MPELPEVETIRRQLHHELVGKRIEKITVFREKSFEGDPLVLVGRRIESIKRKAKVIEVYFEKWNQMVIIHLKMTGQLVFLGNDRRVAGGHPSIDWIGKLPSKHTRVQWMFSDKSVLFFNDMRVFGWMKIVSVNVYEKERKNKPPDVVDEDFNFEYLKGKVHKSGKPIKLLLTDQDKIGGIGNIYANDGLYLAGILPTRVANTLTDNEIRSLRESLVKVIMTGIEYGGSSAADKMFVDTTGNSGRYQDHFLVYEREGCLCTRCDGIIVKQKLGGRSAYFCLKCQK